MDFVNGQEKQILINRLKINYKIFGDGNIPIILLHGWGVDSDKYIETAKQLLLRAENYELQTRIIIPDLPGFGKSDEPLQVWSVDDYVEFVKEFAKTIVSHSESSEESLAKARRSHIPAYRTGRRAGFFANAQNDNKKNLDKIILTGHSFGGRIAIKFAAKYPEKINSLILTGAAGIKHSLTIKQKIFFVAAKTGKIFFSLPLVNKLEKSAQKLLYKAAREKDYYQAQGTMKETFRKVIAEDLMPCLKKIIIPTILIWGENDRSTSLNDGKTMNLKIKNSCLKTVKEANHSLPYQYPKKFAEIAMEFIKSIAK